VFKQLLENDSKDLTAVVAGNDLLALGCYDALAEAGLNCPQDVSIVGFNDIPFLDKLKPPLTTIRIPHYELGKRAAALVLKRLRDPQLEAVTIQLDPQLIVRGSTARPAGV
jgi:LacI family transcriptional regulator